MKTVYIAVMDYSTSSIKLYEKDFEEGCQNEDIENFLEEKTDYKSDQCYFMASYSPINILQGE